MWEQLNWKGIKDRLCLGKLYHVLLHRPQKYNVVYRNLKPYACCDEHSVIFAMWIQCVGQVYILCVPLEDQSYGVWTNPMGHVRRTNPMGICLCTKDQSYGDTMHVTNNLMHVQRTNPMGQCM